MADWTSLLNGLTGAVLGSFGREFAYLPQTGGQAAIKGIFDNTREAQESVPGVYAVLFVRLADFAQQPVRGDEVLVDGVTYKVFDIEADTSGAVVLRLRQV